ncbi:endonuclease/exonuclease/phosphatase family protein [Jeotgalibacillus haloalkalitolerans]|uniref:Endonuclease/exonuclease/phosphatase family protein n=1 Tax=Jeotgalibacillus haloalkalitolerans TaxID=3104292 RepID=A0ABU5KJ40_9BACL|nr:endonuclease/exonuclease/phosphatase family protein [Jeotgalibacillus sp. HH7-29]MDZ5711133.1 endonuclease/exonuclease/phosphatase family protein [Jeotgalibacillus sp. HH7-29]
MKLLTLNCHSWQEEQQLEKLDILAKTITEREYDVIALQEVSQLADAPQEGGYKKGHFGLELLKRLSALDRTEDQMHWSFCHYGYDVYEEGVALISRLPVTEKDSFFITKSEDPDHWKTRAVPRITVNAGDQLIDFYSCHLGWWSDEEELYTEQVDRLLKRQHPDRLSFYMGDFNNHAGLKEEGYDLLLTKGLKDTYTLAATKDSGTTVFGEIAGWEGNAQPLRIDYIFASESVKVKSSRVIFNGEHYPVVSDHFGVEVELKIKLF